MFKNKYFIYVLSVFFYINTISFAVLYSSKVNAANIAGMTKEFKPYYDCMEKICDTGDGIASCYDMKEDIKIVKLKSGAKLKEGVGLLRYANALCGSKIKKLPNKNLYKEGFKTLTYEKYLDVDYLKSVKSLERDGDFDLSFNKLKSCMFEICNPGYEDVVANLSLRVGQNPPEPNYEKCWKVYKTQSYLKKCDHLFKKSSTPFALKGEFFNMISEKQIQGCLALEGAKFDEKKSECSFDVELRRQGKSSKINVLIGESFECSQAYFNIDFGKRKEKTRSIWNYVKGGLKVAAGAVVIVAGAVGGIFTAGTATVAGVIGGVALMTSGAADIGKGVIKDATKQSWKNRGACYLGETKVCEEGSVYMFKNIMK